MAASLHPLKLKIITGYVALVLLFLVLLTLIYQEHRRLSAIDKRSEIAVAQREQAEAITVQILDIALLSEQVITWDEEDVAAYQEKRNKVTVLLQELQKQLPEGNQRSRITSILTLLSDKEAQTLSIVNDLRELRTTYGLLNERMPDIIRQTKQDKQRLAQQIGENYGKNEKKNGGLLGLFHSKKKSRYKTEKENEEILRNNQSRSGTLLRSLAKELEHTHEIKSERLLAHMDSLNTQNAYLNHEISRLITELSITAQENMKDKADAYLVGQDNALRLVSYLGIGAALLAIVFYLILHLDLKRRFQDRIKLEKLNQSNEELLHVRKNMMLTVSHDLRAPLTSIRGCAELLMDERYKEKRARLCETILQSSDNMTALLNALLNFYRLDTGKEQPNSIPFRLKSLFDTLESEFTTVAHKAGLIFSTEYCGEDIVVTGDRERLIQIASNLLSNALKFTPAGEVRLQLCYQEGTLTIEVSDTGTGMSQKQIGLIFQPFERLENAETLDGFGLGLSITQRLIGLLNGTIDIKSEPDKGSTFTVLIPMALAEEQKLEQKTTLNCKLAPGLRILAIDDDAVLLRMTQDMLTRYRVRCDTCQDVQDLTMKMREQEYDLLITDIRMPKINGFDLLELLRASDIGTSRTIPVLAVTARADSREENFTAVGFAGCLYKPFSITELLSAVQRCIGEQQEQPALRVDFSELLSGEQNGKEMLELLIRETKKDIKSLTKSMEKEDRQAISQLVHHLLPLWEIVRTDVPLKELCQVIEEGTDMKDGKARDAVDKVINTGKQLIKQAAEKIKEGYV